MKTTPIANPHAVAPSGTSSQTAQDARARAIAKLTAQQPVPLENPQNVLVEELGAVTNPSGIDNKQNLTSEQAVETQAPETTEETKSPTPKEDPELANRYAQLAKREKQVRLKQQQADAAIKAKEADLKAREEALAQKASFDPSQYIPKSRLKENAWDVLAEEGVTYDQLTQQALVEQPRNPRYENIIAKQQAELNELKAMINKGIESQSESQKQQYAAAVKQIATDVRNLVSNDPEFEMVKATGSIQDVVELIEKTYAEDGIVMNVEDAAKEVENYLVEEGLKLTRIEKIKKQLAASASTADAKLTEKKTQSNPKQPQQMKTLTNATSSTRTLSAKERAILAFKGELKS